MEENTAKGQTLVLIPPRGEFLEGSPGEVRATTLPLTVRHADNGDVHCEMMVVCHYDDDGQLAEVCGFFRQIPRCKLFHQLVAWWKDTIDEARYVVMDITALYPVLAT